MSRHLAWFVLCSLAMAVTAHTDDPGLPAGFVHADTVITDLQVHLRYRTNDNFMGVPVDGYECERLILTQAAVEALATVQEALRPMGLSLLVYDGYRPQRAVDHFVRWAQDLGDQANKAAYYPDVDKSQLFAEGYIAAKSGHSRGSTVDLTIASLCEGESADLKVRPTGNAQAPSADLKVRPTGAAGDKKSIGTTNNPSSDACAPLDMGTPWDHFGPESWPSYPGVTPQQRANRLLLRQLMMAAGFKPLKEEWWHFTLADEPFPDSYFDFPVE
jgi:D-alanyl-D-alanine dipeptidase